MIKTNKIIFTLLILSFGLVLSACNKENQSSFTEVTDDMEVEEINDREVEDINEKDDVDLEIAKWREYENEYYNLKFKYHNHWYFHKTNNQTTEDYIAVYDFFANAEALEKENYAIRLFILNSEESFSEDFSLVKEKQGQGRKYILASNKKDTKILSLMFDNLEIIGGETEEQKNEEIEEQNNKETSLNTYVNKKLGLQFEYPKGWMIREENTKNNNRIYIENQKYENYNISNYPENFLGMWIDYRKPSTETQSYQKQIELYNGLSAEKELLEIGSLDIYTYEFGYNPNSEKSGVGPYLVAIWEKDPYIYNAHIIDSDNKDNNKIKVDVLNQILSTFKFTD
ncbi:hypothetical protein K8R66_04000 [bacterium]|nr:hypothetical protein [bacterium]